ncbi:MBOAT family protein [Helicobacter winghamensis]|uniref:MBOAT family O-acyltransferase n=1 Tax=Helicobacter winghamensis TaxID=157268 RepID=UPI0027A44105
MLFSSYIFIFAFLPIMLLGFYGLRYFNQNFLAKLFLVLGSLFFYAFWEIKYLGLLLLSILINYRITSLMLKNFAKNSIGGGHNKFYLYIGIFFNLALLGFFKYTDFFLENFNLFSKLLHLDFNIPLPHILLPLAISFFTFQQIAFLVDCYKRIDIKDLEENYDSIFSSHFKIDFLDYCLFVSFFPQLIAGPIVHHKEMMPQFKSLSNSVQWDKIAKGVFIFSMGLFKKVFIADSFAKWANNGFSIVEKGGFLNIAESWATSLSYTFQLYFDFSGYCDMAIGLGLLFGIVLPINFNSPYKALNITEFWRKWHITLGRFLKEYLYIPLGGNRGSKLLTLRNLFLVAFLSGVWHGAGFGFIIWGALHGLAMCLHRAYGYILESLNLHKATFLQSRLYKVLCWILTFNFLNMTWVFFRAENLQGAFNLLAGMFGIVWVELPEKAYKIGVLLDKINADDKALGLLIIAFFLVLCFSNSIQKLDSFKPTLKQAIFTGILFYAALISLSITPYVEFIYFNF